MRQVARWTEQMSKYIGNDFIIIIIINIFIFFIIVSLKSQNRHHIHHAIEAKIGSRNNLLKEMKTIVLVPN